MLTHKVPEENIYKMASELTGASEESIKSLTEEVKQGMMVDYIGVEEMNHKK